MILLKRKGSGRKGIIQIIIPIVIVLFGIIAFIIFISNREAPVNKNSLKDFATSIVETRIDPTPTPFPFAEITIPYLRNKNFDTELSSLEKYSENADYTAYITSYISDGYKVNGYLTVPKGQEPKSPDGNGWPAVVFVHGYIPPEEYSTTKNYLSYVDFLARRGLVVFKIDLRGHGSSEGIPYGAYYSADYVIDTLNAYSALQKSNFVNSKKVYLWGHSMAGNVVFRSMVVKKDIPKTVIWAGAVYTYEDLQEFRIEDNSYRPPPQESERKRWRDELFNTHGQFDPQSAFWTQIIPTNYLEGVSGKIQIHHATNDNVVNIGYSRNLIELLGDTEIESQLFEYDQGGHNLVGSSFITAMQKTADFFND